MLFLYIAEKTEIFRKLQKYFQIFFVMGAKCLENTLQFSPF